MIHDICVSWRDIVSKWAPHVDQGLGGVYEGHRGAEDGCGDQSGADTSTDWDKLGPDGDGVSLGHPGEEELEKGGREYEDQQEDCVHDDEGGPSMPQSHQWKLEYTGQCDHEAAERKILVESLQREEWRASSVSPRGFLLPEHAVALLPHGVW